jgi:hypothetical protein
MPPRKAALTHVTTRSLTTLRIQNQQAVFSAPGSSGQPAPGAKCKVSPPVLVPDEVLETPIRHTTHC